MMAEDGIFLQLQDAEIKILVHNERAKVEEKSLEVNQLRASLPSMQKQLNTKQSALQDLQSQCSHGNVTEVLMNIKQIKENIKEIEQDNAQCAAAVTNGELSTNLLSEVSALRDNVAQKEKLLQQLATQLSEAQQLKPFTDRNQITLHFYKQLFSYVEDFFHGNVS